MTASSSSSKPSPSLSSVKIEDVVVIIKFLFPLRVNPSQMGKGAVVVPPASSVHVVLGTIVLAVPILVSVPEVR